MISPTLTLCRGGCVVAAVVISGGDVVVSGGDVVISGGDVAVSGGIVVISTGGAVVSDGISVVMISVDVSVGVVVISAAIVSDRFGIVNLLRVIKITDNHSRDDSACYGYGSRCNHHLGFKSHNYARGGSS